MKNLLVILFLTSLLFSCKKEEVVQDKLMNGVNVNIAISTFNSFRTQGISGFPSVAAITWNDTLSNAAYNFAKAKTDDINTPANIYILSSGQFILDFPNFLNYSRNSNFALHYGFPANSDVISVINSGFAINDQTVLTGLMSSNAKQFGMGQYGDKWFIIMSN
jgi:hypothetical protein